MHFLASVVFMAVAVSATLNRKGTACDSTPLDVEQTLSRILSKMPEEAKIGPQNTKTIFPGLELGGSKITGLHLLRQFSPAAHYCLNGSRFLQLDLINEGVVSIEAPWESCSGRKGSITLFTELSRFTVKLRVVNSNEGGYLQQEDPMVPAATEGMHVVIQGAGGSVEFAAEVLSKVFHGLIREAWNKIFFDSFDWVLEKAIGSERS